MGILRTFAKALTYPLRDPARAIKGSVGQIGGHFRQARALREQKRLGQQELSEALRGVGPAEKFAVLCEAWGLDEQGLAVLRVATRRTRIAMLLLGVVGFAGVLFMAAFSSGLLLMLLGLLALVLLASCLALALRHAWWEYELETKTLIPMREFLGRSDLFARLLRGTK